ncbi:MAG: tRNA lysidine(34) synthetase TilS [Armatimonadia bacterium]
MSIKPKLLQAVARYDLLAPGDRVLLGVSGGQDSVTMALLLHELAAELQVSLVIGHLHHGLRGEVADADLQVVAELARKLGLPFVAERTDVAALAAAEHIGLEEAGRRARYDFFARAAVKHGCNKIAVAHTATDRAETLLINLFRGAGLQGLRSIPPRRGSIIRPLILVSRQETADYCRTQSIAACHDVYNLDPAYLRNRLRADLLPQLEREYGPGIEEALCRAADNMLEELDWTEPLVAQTLAEAREGDALRLSALQELPAGLRHRVLRGFIELSGPSLSDLGYSWWQALDELVQQGHTGKKLELNGQDFVELEYDLVRIRRRQLPPAGPAEVAELSVPGSVTTPSGAIVRAELTNEFPPLPQADEPRAIMDAARAGPLLMLRHPRPGDRFVPLGMSGSKKLQDFFVDNKVPARKRRPLLVTNAAGEVLWVVGHRLADGTRVTDQTQQFLVITVSNYR